MYMQSWCLSSRRKSPPLSRFPATSEVKQAVHRSPLPQHLVLTYIFFRTAGRNAGNIPTHPDTSRSDVSQLGIPSVPPDLRNGGSESHDAACGFR